MKRYASILKCRELGFQILKTNLKSSSEIAGNKVSVNIPPVHNLRQRSTMADGDNNHPQPLWTGFRRFFYPPQKTDGFRTCIILNPYGFGTDSPLHVNDDNHPERYVGLFIARESLSTLALDRTLYLE